jgi:hypothetical protein
MRLDRSASKYTNVRKARRSYDGHLGIQVGRDNEGGEA